MNGFVSDEDELISRLTNLVDFLRAKPVTLDAVMTFLLVDTFYGSPAFGHILHVVRNDGSVAMPAKSGFKSWPTDKFPDRYVTVDTPLNQSLRTEQVVDCGPFEDYPFAGTSYLNDLFPKGFAASVAWPIPGLGSIHTLYSEVIDFTDSFRLSLELAGRIISLGVQNSSEIGSVKSDARVPHQVSSFALSPRQWNILAGMRRGKTNPEIAQDLGFSESLVRQETMKIYRVLGIGGRAELLEMPDEYFSALKV